MTENRVTRVLDPARVPGRIASETQLAGQGGEILNTDNFPKNQTIEGMSPAQTGTAPDPADQAALQETAFVADTATALSADPYAPVGPESSAWDAPMADFGGFDAYSGLGEGADAGLESASIGGALGGSLSEGPNTVERYLTDAADSGSGTKPFVLVFHEDGLHLHVLTETATDPSAQTLEIGFSEEAEGQILYAHGNDCPCGACGEAGHDYSTVIADAADGGDSPTPQESTPTSGFTVSGVSSSGENAIDSLLSGVRWGSGSGTVSMTYSFGTSDSV